MAGNLLLSTGADAILRGQPVNVRYVEFVPHTTDMFGSPQRAHWRAVVVYSDGRYDNNVNLFELSPLEPPG